MGDEIQESKALPPSTCMSFSIFQVYWDDIVMASAFRIWINLYPINVENWASS
jgi:hypothetical protein